jgi:ArsR family transcriptional regulator, virulence genes transcriptional regulator
LDQRQLQHADKAARVLATVAHPLRLLIICLLVERERFVGELLESLGTTKGNISQHLRLLETKGLICKRRDGAHVFYSIKDPKIVELLKCVRTLYCSGLKLN